MKNINLAIPEALLARLIFEGHLCVADVQCLDPESKRRVWQLCLWACRNRVNCKLSKQGISTLPDNMALELNCALMHSDGQDEKPTDELMATASACSQCKSQCGK